jgi:hypothetical protein
MKSACAYCDTLFNAGDSTADAGTARSGQARLNRTRQAIFSEYCAACHGVSAKGNGLAATALRISPADLTTLALQNGGSRYRRIPQGNASFDGMVRFSKTCSHIPIVAILATYPQRRSCPSRPTPHLSVWLVESHMAGHSSIFDCFRRDRIAWN